MQRADEACKRADDAAAALVAAREARAVVASPALGPNSPRVMPPPRPLELDARPLAGPGSPATDGGELVQMLAQRLERLLAENETVRQKVGCASRPCARVCVMRRLMRAEQVRYLEGVVRDLNVEAENHKLLIRQLTISAVSVSAAPCMLRFLCAL